MSDTDYINDHMGGFDSDGLPNFMNAPGFDDDVSKVTAYHKSGEVDSIDFPCY